MFIRAIAVAAVALALTSAQSLAATVTIGVGPGDGSNTPAAVSDSITVLASQNVIDFTVRVTSTVAIRGGIISVLANPVSSTFNAVAVGLQANPTDLDSNPPVPSPDFAAFSQAGPGQPAGTFDLFRFTLTLIGTPQDGDTTVLDFGDPANFPVLAFTGVGVAGQLAANFPTLTINFTVEPIPLPASAWMMIGALALGGLLARKRAQRAA